MKKELFIEQFDTYFELIDFVKLEELAAMNNLQYLGVHTEISKLRKVQCYSTEFVNGKRNLYCVLTVKVEVNSRIKVDSTYHINTCLELVRERLEKSTIDNNQYEKGVWYGFAKSLLLLGEITDSEYAIMYRELNNNILENTKKERALKNAQGDL